MDFVIYANKLSLENGMENVIAIPTKTGIFDAISFREYMTVTMTKTKTYPTLSNRNVYSYNNSHLTYQEILFFQNKSTTIPSIDPNFAIKQTTKDDLQRWKCCYQIY